MTWQDELRQLDEKLASGLISADDYRKRRDGLLAAAANPAKPADPPPDAQQGTGSESTQLIQPVAPPPKPAGPPPDSDRTQAVPQGGWSLQPSYQQPQPPKQSADAERTQVVPGVGSPPGGFPQQQFPPQQPQWGQQPQPQDDGFSSPHWSGPSLPPAPWATNEPWNNNEPWVKQGPEAFENGKSRGKVIAISVVVVLLIGLGVGAWLIWGKGGGEPNNPPVAQSSAVSTPTTPPKVPNAMDIADLPGQQIDQQVKDFAGVSRIDYLTKEEIAAYQTAQSTDAGMVISQLDGSAGRVIVLVTKAGSADLAAAAVKSLVEIQVGYKATKVTGMPTGVTATQAADVIRGHFASKDKVVRIEVQAKDPAKLSSSFQDVLNDQLKVFPADG
ncbi:hypothetical protein [Actinocrispum sp. NPDC049592]|uniref:hypothetical protein n=1 Tax=Actinocrispum sp. NPDC049592 TaxID=3154835 RepID=UPI003436A0CE